MRCGSRGARLPYVGLDDEDGEDEVTHSVVQFVNRTIRHALEGGVTFEAFCASGCDEASGPQDDQNTTQDRCPRHTVRHRARLTPTR
ncbi:hypothetical protein ACFQWA_04330 [Streptomyces thermogriseus]|uniref:DUF7848 domain-containing protein n=1 Tax=Streptomyces thermogriseus TaxID=75292 RepID=A0ABN1SYT1_9ACTN